MYYNKVSQSSLVNSDQLSSKWNFTFSGSVLALKFYDWDLFKPSLPEICYN